MAVSWEEKYYPTVLRVICLYGIPNFKGKPEMPYFVNLVSPGGNLEELGCTGTNFFRLFIASLVDEEKALTSFWCISTPESMMFPIRSGFKWGKMGW